MSEMRCPNDGEILKDVGRDILHCPVCPFNVPRNTKVLQTMYAWLSVDAEGREGFMACLMPNGIQMVLCHSELHMIQKFRDMALQSLATLPGYHARLVEFTSRRVVEEP